MGATYTTTMGDRGRLVVPAELRAKQHWQPGTPLLLIEAANGIVLATREQAKSLLRAQLSGADLVESLLSERRAASRDEDAA